MAAYADLAMEIQKVARGREFEGYAALPGLPDLLPIRYAHALLVGNRRVGCGVHSKILTDDEMEKGNL